MKKIKSRLKKVNWELLKKIGYWLIIAVLILIAGLTAVSALNIPGNYKLLTVLSGSMEPAVKQGSIVVVKPADKYQKGDIITFENREDPRISTTHRILEVKEKEGRTIFITKGDANNAPDSEGVIKERVLGKVILTIPFLGYPVAFAKTQTGLILLVIVPAVIIIYSELLNIKNEMKKILTRTKKKKTKGKLKKRVGEVLVKLLIAFLIFKLPQFGITNAHFRDIETFQGNKFTASTLDFNVCSPENFSPSTLNPGDSAMRIDSVFKQGELPFQYEIRIAKTGGDDDFCGVLKLEAKLEEEVKYSGNLMDFNFGPAEISGKEDSWTFIATLPEDIPDKLQGKSCQFDFIFDGWQLDGNSSCGFSDQEKLSNHLEASWWIETSEDVSSANFDFLNKEDVKEGTNDAMEDAKREEKKDEKKEPVLDFFLRKDKKAVGFKVENIADYEILKYEIVYDTLDGDKGMVSNIKINGKNVVLREDLLLGICSSLGQVCIYDKGITKISLQVVLTNYFGEKKILQKEIDY